jgi:hypothetical protein
MIAEGPVVDRGLGISPAGLRTGGTTFFSTWSSFVAIAASHRATGASVKVRAVTLERG